MIALIKLIFTNKFVSQRKRYCKSTKLILFKTMFTKEIERNFVNKSSKKNN